MITLVGNKCDLARKVDYDTAAKFAQDNNCNYTEVSAYSGHNIKEIFQDMVTEVHKKFKKPDNTTSVIRPPKELAEKGKKKGCKC